MQLNKKDKLNHNKPIVILSLVSLMLGLISSIISGFMRETSISADMLLISAMIFVLFLVQRCLLLSFALKSFNKVHKAIILSVIFAAIAIEHVLNILFYFFYIINEFKSSTVDANTIMIIFIMIIFDFIIAIAFILATINALKVTSKKPFIVVPAVFGLIYSLVFGSFISSTLFYIALLKIPDFYSDSSVKENISSEEAEQALRELNDKLDLELISKEDYQSQRTEIIGKL